MEAVEIKITGRVQGVGFRYFTANVGLDLGLRGWVRNMPDGSVLCRAAGHKTAMDQFRQELRRGPAMGRTDKLEETPLTPEEAAALGPFAANY